MGRTWTDVFFAAVRRGDDPFRAMDIADAWKKRMTPRDTAWRLSRGVISTEVTTPPSIPQEGKMNFAEMDEVYARHPKLPREHQSTAVAGVIFGLEHERDTAIRLLRLARGALNPSVHVSVCQAIDLWILGRIS